MKNKLVEKFGEKERVRHFFSPGRINLIGEHIDYVGGNVLPAAITAGIDAYAQKSEDINIFSTNFPEIGWSHHEVKFDANYDSSKAFMNFVLGVYKELKKYSNKIKGFNLILESSLPVSSGLSSSAAFGMLILEILNSLYDLELSKLEMSIIFKNVENDFIGVKSGIMDQFIIGHGKENTFLLLDTATTKYEDVKLNLDGFKFALFNSERPRELVDSKYNERVEELNEVATILKNNGIDFKELSELYKNNEVLDLVTDETLKRRFKHVLSENQRVEDAVKAIRGNDINKLGAIISKSHLSLRDDYEVSCDEINFIQEKLSLKKDVVGSRIIGAGFGGCVLAIVKDTFNTKEFIKEFSGEYTKKYNHSFSSLEVYIGEGTHEIK